MAFYDGRFCLIKVEQPADSTKTKVIGGTLGGLSIIMFGFLFKYMYMNA